MTAWFKSVVLASTVVSGGLILPAAAQEVSPEMSFFVTSMGLGDGANLGGLEAAGAHCQALAEAAGADNRTCGWPT